MEVILFLDQLPQLAVAVVELLDLEPQQKLGVLAGDQPHLLREHLEFRGKVTQELLELWMGALMRVAEGEAVLGLLVYPAQELLA